MRKLERDSFRRIYSSCIGLGIKLKPDRDFDHRSKDVRPVGIVRDLDAVGQANSMK